MVSSGSSNEGKIGAIKKRLSALETERADLKAELVAIVASSEASPASGIPLSGLGKLTSTSPPEEKIALFRSLFRGREDVFPKRWTNSRSGKSGYVPACTNEWVLRFCGKPKIKCGDCPSRAFVPLTDTIISRHLSETTDGRDFTIGVYPMLTDETCRFLAADFDKESWRGCRDQIEELFETLGIRIRLSDERNYRRPQNKYTDLGPPSSASRPMDRPPPPGP